MDKEIEYLQYNEEVIKVADEIDEQIKKMKFEGYKTYKAPETGRITNRIVGKYSVNDLPHLAMERLERLGNDIDFNRAVVKFWLDNLYVDINTNYYKNIEDNLELAYIVVDYYEGKEQGYNELVYEKLGIEVFDKKQMFEVFGWENMRKASRVVIACQRFIFSRFAKNVDFSKVIGKEADKQDNIVITKTIDGIKNKFSFHQYKVFLLQDLKNLEEIVRKPLSKEAYSGCTNNELNRYVDYSVLTLFLIKESSQYSDKNFVKFLFNYFEIEELIGEKQEMLSDLFSKREYKELLLFIQKMYNQAILISEELNVKYVILSKVLDKLIEIYENKQEFQKLLKVCCSPARVVSYLKIKEKESKQANLVVLKHATHVKAQTKDKGSKSTSYRRLLGVEEREGWRMKKKNYRISEGGKIFKQINSKNIAIRKLGFEISNETDKDTLKELKAELRLKKKTLKNNTLVNISEGKIQGTSKLVSKTRPVLYAELYEYYYSEFRSVRNKLTAENKKDKLGKDSNQLLQETIETASYELFLSTKKLLNIISKYEKISE